MPENAEAMGAILRKNLDSIDSPLIKEIRHRGLFCGLELHDHLNVNGNHFSKILMKNGLITKATHVNTVRFAPALIINEEEIHQASDVIAKSIKQLEALDANL